MSATMPECEAVPPRTPTRCPVCRGRLAWDGYWLACTADPYCGFGSVHPGFWQPSLLWRLRAALRLP